MSSATSRFTVGDHLQRWGKSTHLYVFYVLCFNRNCKRLKKCQIYIAY